MTGELLILTNPFRNRLQATCQRLAAEGIFIGTSSWKYLGPCGLLYDEQRYHCRGKFAETRFERGCLAEYAEVFKTVCVDWGANAAAGGA